VCYQVGRDVLPGGVLLSQSTQTADGQSASPVPTSWETRTHAVDNHDGSYSITLDDTPQQQSVTVRLYALSESGSMSPLGPHHGCFELPVRNCRGRGLIIPEKSLITGTGIGQAVVGQPASFTIQW
jgi:hypothetical protein